jgi:hypothetical protein
MNLSRLIEEHVSTVFLNTDHFAERITVASDSDNQMTVTAVIDIPEVNSGDIEGTMQISAEQFSRFNYRSGVPFVAVRKGVQFDIYDALPENMGMVTLLIRRKFADKKHSDLYDLHGNQIPFSE